MDSAPRAPLRGSAALPGSRRAAGAAAAAPHRRAAQRNASGAWLTRARRCGAGRGARRGPVAPGGGRQRGRGAPRGDGDARAGAVPPRAQARHPAAAAGRPGAPKTPRCLALPPGRPGPCALAPPWPPAGPAALGLYRAAARAVALTLTYPNLHAAGALDGRDGGAELEAARNCVQELPIGGGVRTAHRPGAPRPAHFTGSQGSASSARACCVSRSAAVLACAAALWTEPDARHVAVS